MHADKHANTMQTSIQTYTHADKHANIHAYTYNGHLGGSSDALQSLLVINSIDCAPLGVILVLHHQLRKVRKIWRTA
jgi:hypothetical protein